MKKKYFIPLLITLILLLYAGSSFCEDILTLEKAVRLALDRNPQVLSARQEQVKAAGAVSVARGAFLPSLSMGGSYTREEETSSTSEPDNYGADLTLSQSIYQGGKLRAYRNQADLAVGLADSVVADTEETVLYEVYTRFYDVLLGRENVNTAEDALSYAENYAKEMKKKFEVGLVTGLEVTRAEKLLVTSRKDLVTARNNLESARVDLFQVLKVSSNEFSSIEGDLDYEPFSGEPERSLQTALATRPDLVGLREQVKIQEQDITIAKSGLRPQVSLSATWEYNDPATGSSNGDEDTWSARMNVDFPIFDSGITKGKIIQEEAILEQSIQSVIQKEESVKAEVSNAYLALDTTANSVEEAMKNLELARESLRLAEVGYREGVGIQLDVLDARAELTDARRLLSLSVRNYNLALANLRRTEGRLKSFSLQGDNIGE